MPSEVDNFVTYPIVTCDEETSVAEAERVMHKAASPYIVAELKKEWGVANDVKLRGIVSNQGAFPSAPCTRFISEPT